MAGVIFVNADWSAVVPAGSPEASFGVQPRDAKRLGVDKLPVLAGREIPEPEVKEAPRPADKAMHKPRTK